MQTTLLPSQIHLLPESPGVYFFHNHAKQVLYVGKARVLKKRVAQYFQKGNHNQKTLAMLSQVTAISYMCTPSEHAALILENEKIKELRPKYNILLKDDKSFPYLYLSHHKYPRMGTARGKKNSKDQYFGPFTSVPRMREVKDSLQKLFQVRTCTDSYFSNRSRPCLLHQIGRCSAPCVANITESEYKKQTQRLTDLLRGKQTEVIAAYVQEMEAASNRLEFEKAAECRNTITSLQALRFQELSKATNNAVDYACMRECAGGALIQMTWFREGGVAGSKLYVIDTVVDTEMEVLGQFLASYYTQDSLPFGHPDVVLVPELQGRESLWRKAFDHLKLSLKTRVSTKERFMHNTGLENLNASYTKYTKEAHRYTEALKYMKGLLGLERCSQVECVDISHTFGVETRASCVRLGESGALKAHYRCYSLDTGGDDYASMRLLAKRRYKSLQSKGGLPDILLIDGGLAQLNAVKQVLVKEGVEQQVLVAITKDAKRQSGKERYAFAKSTLDEARGVELPPFVRRMFEAVRDEAHRFAITKHRKARDKRALSSTITEIPGIGKKRHKDLLQHFGGEQGIRSATLTQLVQVPGISKALAETIEQYYKNAQS